MNTDQWTFAGVLVVAVVSLTGHILQHLSAKLAEERAYRLFARGEHVATKFGAVDGSLLDLYERVDDRFDQLTARLDHLDQLATSQSSTRLPRPGGPGRAWGSAGAAALRSKRGDAHRPQRHDYGS